jgi:VCBS repeat-containing protein
VIYTPDADFNGGDSFTFTVSDGDLTSLPAAVSITVNAGNDAPVANAQSVTTAEDTPLSIVLTGSDPEGSALTFSIQTQPVNGNLTGAAPNVTYTPDADFDGPDSFTFTVNDGELDSLPATVSISVTPVNDPPVAVNDTPPAVDEGGLINGTFNVLDNDTDAEDDALTAVLVAGPTNEESFTLNANGTFIYQHDGSDTVTDSFSYQASDGELSNVATVTISINSINDAPVAVDDAPPAIDEGASINGTFNVLDNDTDSENDPLTATIVTPPVNAAAFALNPDGTFTYTHDGSETLSDSFTYQANDGSPSNVATVTLTINPVNDAPSFIGVLPPGLSTPEDTTLTISVTALEIEDPDSDPSTFVLTLDPVVPPDANYTLAGPASITPAENFNGDLSVRATVSDGELDSAPFLIPVTVTAENDLPVLEAEIGPQTAIENSLFELATFGNFSDADGDTLTFSATGLPASNSITIDPVTGLISGTPTVDDARDNAPYVVTVTATDPEAASVSDEFELTISALDRANIGLSIGVTPESGLPNEQLTWTFTAGNPIGPAPGENVELTGSFFGEGLSVAAGSGSSCSINLQTGRADFVCTIGALPVGGTTSVSFTTTASQAT